MSHETVERDACSPAGPATPTRLLTMLIVPPSGVMSHAVTTYLAAFADLAATGVPITAFVDPSLAGSIAYPNVDVFPTTYAELPTTRLAAGYATALPAIRNEVKDTAAYMMMINAKACLPAMAESRGVRSEAYALVDFGLLKCVRRVDSAQERIRRLASLRPSGIWAPGAYAAGRLSVDSVQWRFLGGLVFGAREDLLAAGRASERLFEALLPRVTWEVDLWAWLEASGAWQVRWFPGDHDDSVLDIVDEAARVERLAVAAPTAPVTSRP